MARDDMNFLNSGGVSAFGSLAREVVSVISARQAQSHANAARPYQGGPLDRRLTSRSMFSPEAALAELREMNLSDARIIDWYIPEAARAVGEKWVRNDLGFAEVTIATTRLHSLLAEVEYVNPAAAMSAPPRYDVLVVTCEKEQHTLGSFVAAAQLRRMGACVETLCGESEAAILTRILSNEYDAVLFSCSRAQDLETISRVVIDSKTRMPGATVFALGGIVLDRTSNLKQLTGVDLVTCDVEMVVTACEQRFGNTLRQASR